MDDVLTPFLVGGGSVMRVISFFFKPGNAASREKWVVRSETPLKLISSLRSFSMTQLDSELLTTPETRLDDGDHERFTHIVLEGYTPKNRDFVPLGNSVVEGMINQTAVTALCGKVWVPGRDPKKYPICPTCREIAESMGWSLPND